MNGGPDNDDVDGGSDKDTLNGDGGNDDLFGAFGDGKLGGGAGTSDECDGDAGFDTHTGGCEKRNDIEA